MSMLDHIILEENEKTLVFTFGRYNPPTTGHLKLIEQVEVVASEYNAPYRIYASQSQNPKKNPLEYKEKIEYMKELFPKHKNSIVLFIMFILGQFLIFSKN